MKHKFKNVLMLILTILSLTFSALGVTFAFAAGTWLTVGTVGFSAGQAYYTSLVFDNGTPYVAYRDDGNSFKATVMKFDGANWVAVGSVGFSAGEVSYTSLVFDNGTPYVAYMDGGNSNKATVMKFDGANWVPVGSVGFSAGEVSYTSLVFDNGTPYVAYMDWGNSNKATVMKFDGANWVPVDSAGFSVGVASYISLAFDNGTPYVAYSDWGNSKKATVMKFNGTNWVPVGSAGFSADQADFTSVALDNGTPYVAYQDDGNSFKATVMKFDGANWVAVGSAGFSADQADFTSVALDNGTPYVAYVDWGNSNKATVMKFDGANWVPVGSAGFSAGEVSHTSLVFDNGTPYVVYSDWGNSKKATVMKFDEAPIVNSFTVASSSSSLDIPIAAFSASDDTGVTGYMITESSTAPSTGDAGWTASAPTTYPVASMGSYSLYPWAKDAAGHVSAVYGPASVNITCLNPITVTSNADSGPGTLRQAIVDACVGDLNNISMIDFNSALSGSTIHLSSQLTIAKNVTIDGSSLTSPITLSGDNNVRVFSITGGAPGLTVTLDSLIVTKGATSGHGAGLYMEQGMHVTIQNSTFSDNHAGGRGGGIGNQGALMLINSTIDNNTAVDGGGGISNESGMTMLNSTISNNSATGATVSGGGLFNTGGATITNSTIFGNSSNVYGGGISTTANLTITNSTIAGNSAYATGGLQVDGNVTHLRNTIIANNTSTFITTLIHNDCSDTSDFNQSPPPTPGNDTDGILININNLIEDGSCSPFLNGDPKLGPLANNGGPTQTMALLSGSPAIDAGNDSICAASPVSELDQRGVTRLQGSHCDIGAYEYPHANIDVIIGGSHQKTYSVPLQGNQVDTYPLSNGPVEVKSTNSVPVIAAERVIFAVNGTSTSYSELMGLPKTQAATSYLFPWYNNQQLNSQLRFGNVGSASTIVSVKIHGTTQATTYTLAPGESTTATFPVSDGPVEVFSDGQNIIAAERVIFAVNNTATSYSEMMGLPKTQAATSYLFPWYNNQQLNSQLRFGNVGSVSTIVGVKIHGTTQATTYTLAPGESQVATFAVSDGPVEVFSDGQNIIAAERVIFAVNNTSTSYSELMGLPKTQAATSYLFPWYNNQQLNSQLRFGNVGTSSTVVSVKIHGVTQAATYTLAPGESTTATFGASDGPIEVFSDGQNIIAAERVIFAVNNTSTSYSELMGLPQTQLATSYLFPWYNNLQLNAQLRFGAP